MTLLDILEEQGLGAPSPERARLHTKGANQFRSVTIGYYKNPNGTKSRITKGIEYKDCECGFVEESEWAKAYKEALFGEGPEAEALFEKVLQEVRDHCAWLHNESEREMHALECIDHQAYEHWWNKETT